jgi:nicotinamidase-related amidase
MPAIPSGVAGINVVVGCRGNSAAAKSRTVRSRQILQFVQISVGRNSVKALIVVDVQNGVYAYEDNEVFGGPALIAAINRLIASARAAGSPVVFVQHEDEWLHAGSLEWELVKDLDTRVDTDIYVTKRHGSAFHDTPLAETLRRLGVAEVVLCGLQTELCVDSTLRHAAALNFDVSLVGDAHSTFDTATLTAPQIIEHHNRTLANYARVLPADTLTFAADAPVSLEQQPS